MLTRYEPLASQGLYSTPLAQTCRQANAKFFFSGNLPAAMFTELPQTPFYGPEHPTRSSYVITVYLFQVYANKEIILSGGSLQSPQILMLSGVGPRDHLEEMGIRTIVDLPAVGENLQDHVAVGGTSYLVETPAHMDPTAVSFVLPKILTMRTLYNFVFENTGPLYALPECEVMAFINTKCVYVHW
jgi:hypothetical protein